MTPAERETKSRAISERLKETEAYKTADTILFFASFRDEVATPGMMQSAIDAGKRVLLPKVDIGHDRLLIYRIESLNEVSPGYMGIREPAHDESRLMDINDVEMVIMPGVGFDAEGNRLGYGKGYYDKLIAGASKKIPLVAIAFEAQMCESIPAEAHDVAVSAVVTEDRIIWTGKK